MELKEKLVTLRKKKGLSQLELAEMMKVSRQAVSRWEVGAAVPSTENLKYLGGLYDVPLEYLLNDNVLEPIRMDLEPNEEDISNNIKKKNRSIVLVFIIVIGIVVVAFYAMLFGNRGEESIPMEKIEGSDIVIADDFEINW